MPPRVDEDGDEDDSESETEHLGDGTSKYLPPGHDEKAAYREFLEFLELGCGGSPLQGYPTIMIVISTLPSSVSDSIACAVQNLTDTTDIALENGGPAQSIHFILGGS